MKADGFDIDHCRRCGKQIVLNVPFKNKLSDGTIVHGYTSDHTECGEEYRQYIWRGEQTTPKETLYDLFEALSEDGK